MADPDRLAAVVRRLDPDLLALQEVDRGQPRSGRVDQVAVAADAMGAVAARFAGTYDGVLPGVAAVQRSTGGAVTGSGSGAAYGVALLSRYPVREWRTLDLPRLRLRVPTYRSGRLRRRAEERRVAVVATVATPYGLVRVAGTHLSFLPGWGRRQLRWLVRELGAAGPEPVVLMGDLNLPGAVPARVTGWRPLARQLTFPAAAPVRQIDHVLLRGELGPVRWSAAPEVPLSDHRPLLVDLG